jgi:peptide chain release factor 3
MNKMDRPTKDPLELLDELESVLKIGAVAMNWPLGTGFEFRGVFDRQNKQVHLYELLAGGAYRAPVQISDLNDPVVRERLSEKAYHTMIEELQMLDHAGETFDADAVLSGKQTPVFFGSARNNFGVQLLLDGFLEYAGTPRPRKSNGTVVPMEQEIFSGFIFKIQANMDPRHRDRIAFLRVCSGKFSRDMSVIHSRTGKKVRLSNASKLFGQQRETVDEAFPGDIVGFVGQAGFGIGDTLTEDESIIYNEIPHFPPECFAMLHNPNPAMYKKFRDGMDQLLQEGVVQGFQLKNSAQRVPVLAAVGPLQFEVVQYRLESEYGAQSRLETMEWKMLRWIDPSLTLSALPPLILPTGSAVAESSDGQLAILFPGEWALNYFMEKNPEIKLGELPFRE